MQAGVGLLLTANATATNEPPPMPALRSFAEVRTLENPIDSSTKIKMYIGPIEGLTSASRRIGPLVVSCANNDGAVFLI